MIVFIKRCWPSLVTSKGLARAAPPPPLPPGGQVSEYTLLGAIARHSCSGQRGGDFLLRPRGVCLLLGVWRGEMLDKQADRW
jgi:hypothetical protein